MNILEINQDNRYLSVFRGFLRISSEGNKLADIALDSIMAVLITGNQAAFSSCIMAELAEKCIPLIICGKNYHPVGMFLAVEGNYKQAEVIENQINTTLPFRKNLWKSIVEEKIINQAKVLKFLKKKYEDIETLGRNVKSGDSGNFEAQAARLYFPRLFGLDFLRNYTGGGINAFLNYGYAVIRAAIARYTVAAGFLPSQGLHHKNKMNPFCLVDDLMEPYRPIVDLSVYEFFKGDCNVEKELKPEDKKILAGLLEKNIKTEQGYSPLNTCMQRFVWSLAESYRIKEITLEFQKNLI